MIRRGALLALSAVAALVPLGAALSQQGMPARAPAPAVNEGRFLAFGGLYGDLRIGCVQCHALDGSGNSSGAFPRLTDQLGWYLYKSLRDYAAGLRPNAIMQPIARTLTDRQMQELAAYYASFEGAPYPAEPRFDAQVVQLGGAIAAVGLPEQGVPACNGCHGQGGVGQAPIYPYLAGQYAPYTRHQLMLWKQGIRRGDPMDIMGTIARAMSIGQIEAVAAYYATLRPREVTPEVADVALPPAARMPSPLGLSQQPAAPGAVPPYLSAPTTGAGGDTAAGPRDR